MQKLTEDDTFAALKPSSYQVLKEEYLRVWYSKPRGLGNVYPEAASIIRKHGWTMDEFDTAASNDKEDQWG